MQSVLSTQQLQRQMCPNRPSFVNFAGPRVIDPSAGSLCNGTDQVVDDTCYPGYMANEDWVSEDIYPVADYRGDISLIGYTLNLLEQWSSSRQPQFAYIEARTLANWPSPTGAQMRGAIWTAIVHGARGFWYYATAAPHVWDVATDPDMLNSMQAEDARITSLASVLQGDINPPIVSITAPRPLWATWRMDTDGTAYFFVINEASTAVTRTLKIEGLLTSTVLDTVSSKSYAFGADQTISVSFEPYGLSIFQGQ
jgi:hypothetical protein